MNIRKKLEHKRENEQKIEIIKKNVESEEKTD